MAVKNVGVIDLALIELARGKTDAPPAVLKQLSSRGFVTIAKGRASLTAAGRRRATRLAPMENDLRKMTTAGGAGSRLNAPGGCAITT
jgi:hypothetical protein